MEHGGILPNMNDLEEKREMLLIGLGLTMIVTLNSVPIVFILVHTMSPEHTDPLSQTCTMYLDLDFDTDFRTLIPIL